MGAHVNVEVREPAADWLPQLGSAAMGTMHASLTAARNSPLGT